MLFLACLEELAFAWTSGTVTGDALVYYWPIFPCPYWQTQKSLQKLTRPSFLVVFLEWPILTLLTNRNVALIIQSQLVNKIERIVICRGAPNVDYRTVVFVFDFCIVSRGNWLWKPAIIKVENNRKLPNRVQTYTLCWMFTNCDWIN